MQIGLITNKMKRRDFIKGTVAAALTAALPSNAVPSGKYSQDMPCRKLGVYRCLESAAHISGSQRPMLKRCA
jgi:hypothetical protein